MNEKYAIVTGASSGIGRELAIIAARDGFDLLLAADTAGLAEAADICRSAGATVETLEVDLATQDGVDQLYAATQGRAVDALFANAGHGLGRAFLDQDFDEVRHVIDTNITGTIYLIQQVARDMMDTAVGQSSKADPADVAKTGFEAMLKGEGDVVAGWKNKLQTTVANVTPAGVLAEQHRKMAQPGRAKAGAAGRR